ncbi:MAG: chemotaxis protein CheW [Baekduia sp.]
MSDVSPARQLVVFAIAGEEFALPIDEVQEIIRYEQPRSLASGDPSVRGVISLRGRIVPVLCLATRLGVPVGDGEDTRIVIAEHGDERAGLIVDEVREVRTIEAECEDGPAGKAPEITGVVQMEDRIIAILDAAALLEDLAAGGGNQAPLRAVA